MTIKEIIAQVLDIPVAELPDNASMGIVSGWDSIGHLNILAALSQHFVKEVPFDQITELTDVPSLKRFFGAE